MLKVWCAAGRGDIQPQLHSAVQDVTDKYLLLEETEKQAVRKALIEERARFCIFVSMLRPVVVSGSRSPRCSESPTENRRRKSCLCICINTSRVSVSQDEEVAMLGEIVHLQTIAEDLKVLTVDPHKLPPASEQVCSEIT